MSVITSKRLVGKVAIITGGASGIGESTVRLFAKHGAKLLIADIQDDRGTTLCNDLLNESSDIVYIHCDVTKESDVKNVVDMAISKFGKLDIMFSNAGIGGDPSGFTILGASTENTKQILDVNLFGSFLVAKHAARVMIPEKYGVILFTASVSSVVSGIAPHAYTMSKHAIVGLTKNLCVELGQHGIRVNCISPSTITTPMVVDGLGLDKKVVDDIICASSVLKGVVPTADDVADAVLYLASGESKFVSGINLVVDGGYSTTNQDLVKLLFQQRP